MNMSKMKKKAKTKNIVVIMMVEVKEEESASRLENSACSCHMYYNGIVEAQLRCQT